MLLQFASVARQLDLLLIDRIAQLQREIFAQGEAEPRAEAQRLGAVGNVAVGQLLALEQIEAERDAIVQQIGLDERQRTSRARTGRRSRPPSRYRPRPRKLRSEMLTSASAPSVVE